jgi:hypothetical protein
MLLCMWGIEIRKVELAPNMCTFLSGVSARAMDLLVLTNASKVCTHVCNVILVITIFCCPDHTVRCCTS